MLRRWGKSCVFWKIRENDMVCGLKSSGKVDISLGVGLEVVSNNIAHVSESLLNSEQIEPNLVFGSKTD